MTTSGKGGLGMGFRPFVTIQGAGKESIEDLPMFVGETCMVAIGGVDSIFVQNIYFCPRGFPSCVTDV